MNEQQILIAVLGAVVLVACVAACVLFESFRRACVRCCEQCGHVPPGPTPTVLVFEQIGDAGDLGATPGLPVWHENVELTAQMQRMCEDEELRNPGPFLANILAQRLAGILGGGTRGRYRILVVRMTTELHRE